MSARREIKYIFDVIRQVRGTSGKGFACSGGNSAIRAPDQGGQRDHAQFRGALQSRDLFARGCDGQIGAVSNSPRHRDQP